MKECPVCHASIDALVECLQDRQSPENRAIAYAIMENCNTCKTLVKEVIKKEASKPDLPTGAMTHHYSITSTI